MGMMIDKSSVDVNDPVVKENILKKVCSPWLDLRRLENIV